MQWPRSNVRMSMRRLMVAVALLGVVFGGVRLVQRRHFCLARALRHEDRRTLLISTPQQVEHWEERLTSQWYGRTPPPPWPAGPPFVPAMADYHARMRDKWQRAARLPWLSVEPDPLEP
jgi:hypothetical protein